MAERRGLTAPSDPAGELRQLMREEEEGRKETSNEAVKPPSLEGGKEGAREGIREDRKETSYQGRKEAVKPPAEEGWKVDVKARAKAGAKEQRKVRLNVDIPADIHLAMKMWCLREGYNLNELVPALVAAFMEGEA